MASRDGAETGYTHRQTLFCPLCPANQTAQP